MTVKLYTTSLLTCFRPICQTLITLNELVAKSKRCKRLHTLIIFL